MANPCGWPAARASPGLARWKLNWCIKPCQQILAPHGKRGRLLSAFFMAVRASRMKTMSAPTDTSAFSKVGDGDKLSESTAHPVPQGSIEIIYCDRCGMLILGGKKNAVARAA